MIRPNSIGTTLYVALSVLVISAAPRALYAQCVTIASRWESKGAADSPFTTINGMVEDAEGRVWIADTRGAVVVRMDGDGRNVEVVASDGPGPGEVGGPIGIASTPDGRRIVVHDVGHSAFEVFSADGSFVRRVGIEEFIRNPKGFTVTADGHFVVSGGIRGNEYGVHWFDTDGALLRSAHAVPETRVPRAAVMVAGGPVDALANGDLLFSDAAPHRILRFPANGGEPTRVASDPDLLEEIGDDFIRTEGSGMNLRRTFQWNFPQSRGVYHLDDDNILNVVRFTDRGETVWEVWAPTGELLARDTVGRAYEPWDLTRNGDVLASYRDAATDEHIAVRLDVELRSAEDGC